MIRGSSSPFPDMRKGEERCAGSRVDAEYDFHSRASALDREIDILPIAHAQNQLVLQSKGGHLLIFFRFTSCYIHFNSYLQTNSSLFNRIMCKYR